MAKIKSKIGLVDVVEFLKEPQSEVCYAFPEEYRPIECHVELLKNRAVMNARQSMTKEGQFRNVKVQMSVALMRFYKDEDDNFLFNEHLLEEIEFQEKKKSNQKENDRMDSSDSELAKTLSNIEKTFSIPKFDKSRQKAADWLEDFETECSRFRITSDEIKVRSLKYFMLDASDDWYKANISQLPMNDFGEWRSSFIKVFAEKGWSRVEYALAYKYITGPLADYAIKKLRLLLEVERHMTVESRINLIVFGLPSEVRKLVDREKIDGVESLINQLTKFESLKKQDPPQSRNKSYNTNYEATSGFEKSMKKKEPCGICESLNFPNRFHPVDKCWNKEKKKTPFRRINLNENPENIEETNSKN